MMTEMQKQFEEWAKENLKCDLSHNGQHYNHTNTYHAWAGWQARAAVVVKTDTMKDPSYEATGMVYLDAVEQALDEEGIRYE